MSTRANKKSHSASGNIDNICLSSSLLLPFSTVAVVKPISLRTDCTLLETKYVPKTCLYWTLKYYLFFYWMHVVSCCSSRLCCVTIIFKTSDLCYSIITIWCSCNWRLDNYVYLTMVIKITKTTLYKLHLSKHIKTMPSLLLTLCWSFSRKLPPQESTLHL